MSTADAADMTDLNRQDMYSEDVGMELWKKNRFINASEFRNSSAS